MRKFLPIFFIFFSTLYAEYLDVDKLFLQRSQRYSLKDADKIIVFSAKRTGSTLLYNILHFLFEKDGKLESPHYPFTAGKRVLKSHSFEEIKIFKNERVFYMITVRNPLEALISELRVLTTQGKSMEDFVHKGLLQHKRYLMFYEHMNRIHQRAALVKYEEFDDDVEKLIRYVEAIFSIKVDSNDVELIKKGYAKENVLLSIENLKDFDKCREISGFHGRHIQTEEFYPPEEFWQVLEKEDNEIKRYFSKFGYFLER